MGFLRKDKKSDEENENIMQAENTESSASEYSYGEHVKQKECKYCRVMIPQKAKICPNCKKDLGKNRVLRFFILLLLIVLCAAGVYYYIAFYRGTKEALGTHVVNSVKEAGEESDAQQKSDAQNNDINLTINTSGQDTDGKTPKPEAAEQEAEADTVGILKKEELLETEQTKENESDEADDENTQEEVELEIKKPVLESETICGADGPILDYADENRIIFHDYYGLFVYDRESETITGAVDLQEIGCQYTQGDAYCDTVVDAGGETVYLHPLNVDDVYIYNVEKRILTKKTYTESMFAFRHKMEQTRDYVEPDYTVWRSVGCAVLDENTVLYLESGSGLVEDLFYVVEDDGERMTSEDLMDSWLSGEDTAEAGEDDRAHGLADPEREENESEMEMVSAETEIMPEGEPQESEAAEEIDVSAYSEEEFRNLCRKVDYRKLLREQDAYLNGAVAVELTVLAQIDGGLFDDNIYYICAAEDKKGYLRYYVIRDDRAEDDMLILEGDVLRIYGQFFDTCVCPSEFLETRTEIPALTMVYCDLLEE